MADGDRVLCNEAWEGVSAGTQSKSIRAHKPVVLKPPPCGPIISKLPQFMMKRVLECPTSSLEGWVVQSTV